MADVAIKHFDYLADFDTDLEAELGLSDLTKDVNHWRCTGTDYPGEVLVSCRTVIETALTKLASPLPDDRMDLIDLIDYAEDEGIIDHPMALKCHEIRTKGNKSAHKYKSTRAIDAKMILELLDDFLRWNAVRLRLIPASQLNAVIKNDPIFLTRPEEEMATMTRTAKLAAAFTDDRSIDRKAQRAKNQAVAYDETSKSTLEKLEDLIRQAEAIAATGATLKDEESRAAIDRLFVQCDQNLEAINAGKQIINHRIDAVNAEIKEILSEHDYIKRLLQGDKQATERQLDVMAFPRGSNTVTNILQIAGGAGTGKTLCLLAKLIAEIDDNGQQSFFERKNALFICFNKALANYVRGILAGFDGNAPNIEVAHYDEYVNQLVRDEPKAGFEHLAEFSQDARYPGWRIIYGSDELYDELLKEARQTVARLHPQQARQYYLDSTNEDDFQWMRDELSWIEAHFLSDEDAEARYPNARRTGRGTKRQPSEDIRRIILEVRREFNNLLRANRRYTIDQATKRLLASDDLPSYDAIAIDEVQDFSLMSIKLVVRFRRGDRSKVFLSGDENQKIYQRDFTWKELDESLKGYTITLYENKRNSEAISCFCDRLLGKECSHEKASRFVHVSNADDRRTVDLLRVLADPSRDETTVLISSKYNWSELLQANRVPVCHAKPGDICKPGLYLMGDRAGKGLEFDNVVVDYTNESSEDEGEEKRLRYVHFTRARKRLYIRYQGTPPKLLTEYYADFLG